LAFTALLPSAVCLAASPLGTAFTYQGRLNAGGNPANGSYDLRFAVFDAAQEGSVSAAFSRTPPRPSPTACSPSHSTSDTNVFTGEARWLEIGVRTNSSPTDFTVLSPRQPLAPSPYALHAPTAGSAAAVTGPVAASQLTARSRRRTSLPAPSPARCWRPAA